MSEPLLKDLIEVPTSVHKSDFVISLEDGVDDAERLLSTYVVTDQLRECFDSALSLITSAVDQGMSKGAYLHGSFGSGKSHFMAVLHLLLQGEPKARAVPELAPVIDKHDERLQGRKFLLVPYHMIGKHSMEDGVLGGYVDHVRKLHPDAALPGVYVADKLLDNAQQLRRQMGDEAFFANLGSDGAADDGFGDLASGWDAASFDAALAAGPRDPERDRLVSDYIDAYASALNVATQSSGQGYVPFDDGLAAISRHAHGLGYDGVVLFLDELILWFATQMADHTFVQREAPKISKLVEAASSDRPSPIVSLIARQRDLREFLGAGIPGAERLNFSDSLDYFEGRFDTIELANRNLTAIVEKRILKPKGAAESQQLDAAFQRTASSAGKAVDTLLTSDADREAFRRVYPFSPALVETLVALSNYLQRDRTALRLLQQLLVDQRETLEVGDLVPLGDLYDVIRSGDDPLSTELKRHFAKAKQLYDNRLRPMLLATHNLTEDDAAALPMRSPFRADDRLAKTLLLAALVPSVEPLRNLTARRLADLNHGTIRSPIAGQERTAVLKRVRAWAQEIGELRIEGDEQDPTISLRLTDVDTEAILEKAGNVDNAGTRRQKLRDLISTTLGIESAGALTPSTYTYVWRGSRRTVEVKFANVRDHTDISDSEFRAGDVPRAIIDFPFDEDANYGPADDHARVSTLCDTVGPTPTVCWLPRFLTGHALDRLGRLVILDHVLSGDRFEQYADHLAPNDRIEARDSLRSSAEAVRNQVKDIIRQAYGIDAADERFVRTDLTAAEQFASLDPTLSVRPPVAASLVAAFEGLLDQIHAHLYPAHPDFEDEVRLADLKVCLEHVRRAARVADGRVDVPTPDRKAVRKVLGPLKLATTGEAHLTLDRQWKDHFHVKQTEHGVSSVTVEHLRRWIDEPSKMGLDPRVANLVVSAYVLQDDRVLVHGGVQVQESVERLEPTTEARTQKLPPQDVWDAARGRAHSIFGVPDAPLLNAANVSALVKQLTEEARTYRDAVASLPDRLASIPAEFAPDGTADRTRTAAAAVALLDGLQHAEDVDAVAVLAAAEVPTSEQALGRSIKSAAEVAGAVGTANWELLRSAIALTGEWESAASGIREQLRAAMAADELVTSLPAALDQATVAATDLVGRAVAVKPPPEKPGKPEGREIPEDSGTSSTSWTLDAQGSQKVNGPDAAALLRELLDRVDTLEELDVHWKFRG